VVYDVAFIYGFLLLIFVVYGKKVVPIGVRILVAKFGWVLYINPFTFGFVFVTVLYLFAFM